MQPIAIPWPSNPMEPEHFIIAWVIVAFALILIASKVGKAGVLLALVVLFGIATTTVLRKDINA